MIRYFFLLFILGFQAALAQNLKVIKYPELQEIINSRDSEIHVINFWATWCGPCVKELPEFQALHVESRPGVKVTLVSLDFADKLNRVDSFMKRKQISVPAFLLDEVDGNTWIDKVEPSWSGAIPATLILNPRTGKRKFVGGELKEGELETLIDEFTKS